jgi:hypothetical protein
LNETELSTNYIPTMNENETIKYETEIIKNETESFTSENYELNINSSNEYTIGNNNEDNFEPYDSTYESSSSESNHNNSIEYETELYTNNNNNTNVESLQSTNFFDHIQNENTTVKLNDNLTSNFITTEDPNEILTTYDNKEQNELNHSTTNPILATIFPLKYKSSLDESCKRRACSELEFKYCSKFNNASCRINNENESECVCLSTYKGKHCEERYSFCVNLKNREEPVCRNGGINIYDYLDYYK